MKDIIYFNGDSYTDHSLFRHETNERLGDYFVINNAISGNWNPNIVKQSNTDLVYLNNIALANQITVHAYIFLSEVLRSPIEINLLKGIINNLKTQYSINEVLGELNKMYYLALVKTADNLSNVKLHVSTAFTDVSWDTDVQPMYKTIVTTEATCYSVSYLNKHDNSKLLKIGLTLAHLIEMADIAIARCDLIDAIPHSANLHINDATQYKSIMDSIQRTL